MTYRRGNILKKQTYHIVRHNAQKNYDKRLQLFAKLQKLSDTASTSKKKNVKIVTYIKHPFPSYSVLLPACFCLSQKYVKYITRIYQI